MKNRADTPGAAGFTLVELMIAMLILAIGIMAVLSMQFTSLGGAVISRDNSNAADIARRITNVMRAESQQWRSGSITTGGGIAKVYETTNTMWANPTILGAVAGAGDGTWGNASWVSLFTGPVDARLSDTGTLRYCAYARGAYLNDDIFQVQIAVVFPSANNTYDASEKCMDGEVYDQLNPQPVPEKSMQVDGFRVQYFGAQILRRAYLAPGGGVGGTSGA